MAKKSKSSKKTGRSKPYEDKIAERAYAKRMAQTGARRGNSAERPGDAVRESGRPGPREDIEQGTGREVIHPPE